MLAPAQGEVRPPACRGVTHSPHDTGSVPSQQARAERVEVIRMSVRRT